MLFWTDPDTWCLWHHSQWGDPWERGGVSLNVPVCHRISPARGHLSFSTSLSSCNLVYGEECIVGEGGTVLLWIILPACVLPAQNTDQTLTPSSHSKTNRGDSLNTDLKCSYPLWPHNFTTTLMLTSQIHSAWFFHTWTGTVKQVKSVPN